MASVRHTTNVLVRYRREAAFKGFDVNRFYECKRDINNRAGHRRFCGGEGRYGICAAKTGARLHAAALRLVLQSTACHATTTRLLTTSLLSRYINRREGPTDFHDLLPQQQEPLSRLHSDGYAPLPALLDAPRIADIRDFLRDKSLSTRKTGVRQSFPLEQRPEPVDMADYRLEDIVAAPHILALANSRFLLGIAENYIGCKPTLSALVLRWSFPSAREGHGIQAFHRDGDDWRHLKIFVYLTDVDEGAGPHVYVKGSQQTPATLRLHEYSDAEIARRYGSTNLVTVTGPAGFSFAGDTAGVHKGTMPRDKPRLMLQMQYSLLPSYIYRYRPVPYSGPLTLDAYVNRLIVARARR